MPRGRKKKAEETEILQENADVVSEEESVVQESAVAEDTPDNTQSFELVQENTAEQTQLKKVKIKKVIGHEERTNRWGYVFVAPFLIVFFIFNFWPTINTFIVSFTDLRAQQREYRYSSDCNLCRGSGHVIHCYDCNEGRFIPECEKCEGTGEIDFATCESCDGLGLAEETECYRCRGRGFIAHTATAPKDAETFTCMACKGSGRRIHVVENYTKLIKDRFFWGALGNTFIIWGFNFIPQLGIALILAIWLSDSRLNLAGKGLFRAIVYLPNLLTAVSVAFLFRSIFGFNSYVNAPANQFLRIFADGDTVREAINFFNNVAFNRGLVSFIQWWMWYGHTLIMLMAGITSIPVSLYESATVDGANSRQTAWYITLPLLRPIMLYILVTSMIGGMQMFDIPFLLTTMLGGRNFGIRTTVVYQYNIAFQGNSDYSYGAAISIGIFVVTIMLAFLIFFLMQDRSEIKRKKGGNK